MSQEHPEPIGETMPVEMYVGRVEPQDWYTVKVDIPADTPEDKIEVVATGELLKFLAKDQVYAAFHGVYHVPSPDERELYGDCGSPTEQEPPPEKERHNAPRG